MLLEPSAQSVFGTIPRVNHAGAAVIWFWAYRCCLPSLPIVICLPGPRRALAAQGVACFSPLWEAQAASPPLRG